MYETVIGLEVHAQLSTKTKLFCGCSTQFGATPNQNTCEVCLGMPGALPVVNRRAVELAVRAALALECAVQLTSQWARKNYFYPDLPKGYQISQLAHPIALGGRLAVQVGDAKRLVRLTRIHMEEDAGKSVHDDATAKGRSYVDFNRGGTPLVEIVSEPDIRSAAEAAEYLRRLRQILRATGVCDGNMEQGSLRCDANVSIRPAGQSALGTRTEIKNLNSFRFLEQAIEYEALRQEEVLSRGERVVQKTRLWDSQAKVTRSMRSKEEAHDYRYFPDPDLPLLQLGQKLVDDIALSMPELPAARLERYKATLGLADEDARMLLADIDVAQFFEMALSHHNNAKSLANWMIHELGRERKEQPLSELPFGPKELAELVELIDNETISGKIAKDILPVMVIEGGSPRDIVKARGLEQVTDTAALEALVDEAIAKNPQAVETYRAGKNTALGFLMGQIMKETHGKANPRLVNELLKRRLG